MTGEGEAVTWPGQGVGRLTGHGMAASWRASVCCQTTSERLARLNGIAGLLEFEVDQSGNLSAKTWEWKQAGPAAEVTTPGRGRTGLEVTLYQHQVHRISGIVRYVVTSPTMAIALLKLVRTARIQAGLAPSQIATACRAIVRSRGATAAGDAAPDGSATAKSATSRSASPGSGAPARPTPQKAAGWSRA